MVEIIGMIIEMVMGGLLGFIIGIVFVFYSVYKERPDLYAELEKWAFAQRGE